MKSKHLGYQGEQQTLAFVIEYAKFGHEIERHRLVKLSPHLRINKPGLAASVFLSGRRLFGWAIARNRQQDPISIEFSSDSEVISLSCCDYWPGEIPTWASHRHIKFELIAPFNEKQDGANYRIFCRRDDLTDDLGSIFVENGMFNSRQLIIDFADRNNIRGWVWDPEKLGGMLSVTLQINGERFERLANIYRSDLHQAGFGHGIYGFNFESYDIGRKFLGNNISISSVGKEINVDLEEKATSIISQNGSAFKVKVEATIRQQPRYIISI